MNASDSHDDERPEDPFEEQGLERLLMRAERDPEASARLDFLADVVAAAELERASLARDLPEERAPARRSPRSISWLLLAAVAGLLAVLWLAWPGDARRDPRLLAGREAPRYLPSELRAPGPDELSDRIGSAFAEAMEPYGHGDWNGAASALEAFLALHPEHLPAHFYLAAAREQLGDVTGAEAHYRRAAEASDALLSEHARFRLALLWWARGESERARRALTALRDEGGELAGNARAALEDTEGR